MNIVQQFCLSCLGFHPPSEISQTSHTIFFNTDEHTIDAGTLAGHLRSLRLGIPREIRDQIGTADSGIGVFIHGDASIPGSDEHNLDLARRRAIWMASQIAEWFNASRPPVNLRATGSALLAQMRGFSDFDVTASGNLQQLGEQSTANAIYQRVVLRITWPKPARATSSGS